jgi:hypothetical protein
MTPHRDVTTDWPRRAEPRLLLIGYVLGVAAMSPAPLVYFWLFAPVGALIAAGLFGVAKIWSRGAADLALGALAATLFGVVTVVVFLVGTANQ